MKHVVVIGGGFAGLSAAVDLAARGIRVTVLEGRGRLGGRAYSFTDEASGEVVDNGQHAMMGCYHHTLAFLERIGAGHKVVRQPRLRVDMVDPVRGTGTITAANLPSPLHVAGGILGYRLLSGGERMRALWAGLRLMAMRRRKDPRLRAQTVEAVLVALGQSANARASFWHPVVVATLNEAAEHVAAAPFAEVLARAFFSSRADSQFVLARVGLSELYADDAERFVTTHGGTVRRKATVVGLDLDGARVAAVVLRTGERIAVDACISAVPPRMLSGFLPPALQHTGPFAGLSCFTTSPIVSTHLWLDRPVVDSDFVGFIDTTTQWIFNRDRFAPSRNGDARRGQCLSAVISAGRDVAALDTAAVADQVVADLRRLVPAAQAAEVIRAVVVKEKHATISLTPAAEARRPGETTPVDNLFLAGDWIETQLPATIESAVVSGTRAAARAAARLGAA